VADRQGRFIEVGAGYFPILGYGSRMFKNYLNGQGGENTENLLLQNVAVVSGFHVNIISEGKLKEAASLWYCGYDLTLRYGTPECSKIMRKLVRHCNIIFFEYKPLSSYLQFNPVPLSEPQVACMLGPIIMAFTSRGVRPRLYNYPREDTIALWYLRSGYLGRDAFRHLVERAKGVKIRGSVNGPLR